MARTPGVADAMGFVVPKDVENHPSGKSIAAEARAVVVGTGVGVVVGAMLLLAGQHYQWTTLGYQMDQVKKAAAVEETTHRRLLLEQATLRSPQRIELIATTSSTWWRRRGPRPW